MKPFRIALIASLFSIAIISCNTEAHDGFTLELQTIYGEIKEVADENSAMGLIKIYPDKISGEHTMYVAPYYYTPDYDRFNCGDEVAFHLAHSDRLKMSIAKNIKFSEHDAHHHHNLIAFNTQYLMNDHNCANHSQFGAHKRYHYYNKLDAKRVLGSDGNYYLYLPLINDSSGSPDVATQNVFRLSTDLSLIMDDDGKPKIDPATGKPFIFYINETNYFIEIEEPSGLINPRTGDNKFIVADMIDTNHDNMPH